MRTLGPTVPTSSSSRSPYSRAPGARATSVPALHAKRRATTAVTERAIDDASRTTRTGEVDDATERRIAAGLRDGDQQALADAFAIWGTMVHAFCASRVGRDAADDLTQQVFVAAWRGRANFDPDRGVVPGWLIGIARNLANRSFRRNREIPTADAPKEDSVLVAEAVPVPDGPDAVADRLLLGAALQRLGDDQRRTLELGYLEGLTQQEVADRLGLPLGTVKSHQRRGLQRLRQALGGAS
jgi:RNA polymerase sigma factor (sigma-70 family)